MKAMADVPAMLTSMSQIGRIQYADTGNFLRISRKLNPIADYTGKSCLKY